MLYAKLATIAIICSILWMFPRQFLAWWLVSSYLFCLLRNCFTKKRSIIFRLHIALEYFSKSKHPPNIKTRKDFPISCKESMITATAIATSKWCRLSSTVPDVTKWQFGWLMYGEHAVSIYQIMDFLLSGQGRFVREISNYLLKFQSCKNSNVQNSIILET